MEQKDDDAPARSGCSHTAHMGMHGA